MNKSKGHHTPFMVQLPHLNSLIVNQYPGMTQGPNNGMFYVPSSASKNQDASSNSRKSRLDSELYAAKPRFRLIKEVVSNLSKSIIWHSDHFAELREYDFHPITPIATLCKSLVFNIS